MFIIDWITESTFLNMVRDDDNAIRFFQNHGILAKSRCCENGHQMILNLNRGSYWSCGKEHNCKKQVPFRKNTFLERTFLTYSTVAKFIYYWTKQQTTIEVCIFWVIAITYNGIETICIMGFCIFIGWYGTYKCNKL